MVTTRPNPLFPVPPELVVHIGHRFHPHDLHTSADKQARKCSGRWWCETDKTWITAMKCEEK